MAVLAETVAGPDTRKYPHRRACPPIGAPTPPWPEETASRAQKAQRRPVRLSKPVWRNFCIYFQDEAPAIGSGYRPIDAKVGHKWVRVRPRTGGRASRISRATWDRLVKETSAYVLRNTDPEYITRRAR